MKNRIDFHEFLVLQKMFFEKSKVGWVLCTAAAVLPSAIGFPAELAHVVATTTVIADLVKQVGGDAIQVESLMGAGIDPHSYRATPRDADRLLRANLVVACGLHLEGKLADLLARLGRRKPVVFVGDSLPQERLLPIGEGLYDPHVWFDAALWSEAPAALVEPLGLLVPSAREAIADRSQAYATRLRMIHDTVRGRIATIPPRRRVMITAHDAFRYFARAYDIEVIGVQGTSTESEAGLADINRLVSLMVTRDIPAVFVETSVADRNVAAIRVGAAARGHVVNLGGRLYSDALGEPGSGGETLEAALAANVETIVTALRGDAAPDSDGKNNAD